MFIYCYQYEAIVSLHTYSAHGRAVDDRDAVHILHTALKLKLPAINTI